MALILKPLGCSGCPLYDDPQIGEKVGFSHSEGSSALGILVCGEALGENERTDALPFRPYAASGSILERAFRRIGIDREQVALTNLIRCRPPNNKLEGAWYEAQAVGQCSRYLREAIEKFRPRVIVALGNLPLKYLTGMVGRNRSISMLRGFVLNGAGVANGIPVVASFHPAFLARGARNLIGVLARDIQLAVELSARIAGGEEIKSDIGIYDINPVISKLDSYRNFLRENPALSISYDIETDELERDSTDESEAFGGRFGNITQIQFSWEPRQAVVCDWREPYIQFAKDIMALPNPKWGFNSWGYDDPRLEHYGVKINGESHDIMWAHHHLQADIPRNLQFVTSFYAPEMPPWKHTSNTDLATYGGCDVDSLQRIGIRLFDDLKMSGILHGYQRHIVGLWPILKRMCQRGLPVNLEARAELRKKIEERSNEVYQEIQRLVPLELRGTHPSLGYKVNPAEVRALANKEGISISGRNRGLCYEEGFKALVLRETGLKCKEFEGVERFYREKDFLPNSSDQLKIYLRFKGIPVPTKLRDKNEDGTAKETTEEKELERLFKKTQDPVIGGVREYRKLKKILSTYIDGWQADGDGLVHSTFTFATATGQLSSRSPNIQNAPKHGELAKEFNKILYAREGYTIVSIDWTAFHALTLGYCSRDADYMRLARLDIHSYLAGQLLRLDRRDAWLRLSDSELGAVLLAIKQEYSDIRNQKAKPTILGYGFGLGASKLYDMNIESFDSKKEAQAIIDLLNSLFPKTAAFREEVKEEASKNGLLRSPFGYLRRFQDVYSWSQVKDGYEPKWGEKLIKRGGKIYKRGSGDEGEAAIAWKPANFAYGHAKEVVLSCEERGYLEKYRLVNFVHDELRLECPNQYVDECVVNMSTEMEARSKVLVDPDVAPLGLACGVEASVGPNVAELKCVYKTDLEKVR